MQDMEQVAILTKLTRNLHSNEDVQKKKFDNGVQRIIIHGTSEVTVKQWIKYLVKYMEMLLIVVVFQK